MKKIILFIILFFGIMPVLKQGKLSLSNVTSAYADDYGDEDGDGGDDSGDPCDPSSVAYNPDICYGNPDSGDPCDPGSAAYNPSVCNSTDQCDPDSPYYDDTVCEQQTCNPQSTNYDVDECDMQDCDDSSIHFDPSQCEYDTCDPDNINYDVDECDAQDCDDSSVHYDPSQCEYDTCDPDNVNYDIDECDGQICDPTSVRYDPAECKLERCDPDNVNYSPTKCAQPDCDAVATVTASQIPATATEVGELGNGWGLTVYHLNDYEINIGACTDGTTWHAVLLSITTDYSQQARLLPGVSEVNTSLTDYCAKITDLVTMNPSGSGAWYMLSAVQAHETAHVTYNLSAAIDAEPSVAAALSTLTVPDTGQSEADAITQLKSLPDYTIIRKAQIDAIKKATLDMPRPDDTINGVTFQAERSVTYPVAKQICDAANAANLPTCPACALIP